MPRSAVTRRVHFNAAHRLHNPDRPDDWNRATFGACNNPSFHGHNYELDVTVEGEIDPETGYVMDLGRLNELVEERLLGRLDHRNLNVDVEWFSTLILGSKNGMLKTEGVYQFDTQRDLLDNLLGALVAVALYYITRRAKAHADARPGFPVEPTAPLVQPRA